MMRGFVRPRDIRLHDFLLGRRRQADVVQNEIMHPAQIENQLNTISSSGGASGGGEEEEEEETVCPDIGSPDLSFTYHRSQYATDFYDPNTLDLSARSADLGGLGLNSTFMALDADIDDESENELYLSTRSSATVSDDAVHKETTLTGLDSELETEESEGEEEEEEEEDDLTLISSKPVGLGEPATTASDDDNDVEKEKGSRDPSQEEEEGGETETRRGEKATPRKKNRHKQSRGGKKIISPLRQFNPFTGENANDSIVEAPPMTYISGNTRSKTKIEQNQCGSKKAKRSLVTIDSSHQGPDLDQDDSDSSEEGNYAQIPFEPAAPEYSGALTVNCYATKTTNHLQEQCHIPVVDDGAFLCVESSLVSERDVLRAFGQEAGGGHGLNAREVRRDEIEESYYYINGQRIGGMLHLLPLNDYRSSDTSSGGVSFLPTTLCIKRLQQDHCYPPASGANQGFKIFFGLVVLNRDCIPIYRVKNGPEVTCLIDLCFR